MKKLLKDKRGLEFKKALISLTLMSMMIVGIGVWINDWNTQYDSGLTYDLGNYDKSSDLSNYATNSKTNISVRGSVDTSSGDFEGVSLRGAFSIINNIFVPFNVVLGDGGLLDSIKERWGIPNYIMVGLITILILAMVFSIIGIFFRRPRSTA